ncbi:GntR family transcriptional regulator [Paracoccus nototheniae]|uniref:GntR family transcriptional regulator n=1 Tax=Paracoccus nototheniae TaxID=2489002 RepID=A0ABW4DWM5_9RHOB|nr:GntR family transcriptional regulator [Paracoccus nototheniae]
MTDALDSLPSGLAQDTAARLRDQIITGQLRPGQRLSEARLAADLSVSRNTLREVFRLLVHEGLLTHLPHRGVSVAVPSMAGVLDIYRLRRLIEIPALAQAWPRHTAIARMAGDVASARAASAAGDWQGVGSANMRFHAGIVALADSPRLTGFFAQTMAELRLAFGLLDDPEQLHAPFLQDNGAILDLLQQDQPLAAADRLAAYLDRSERVVMTAFARLEHGVAQG